VVDIMPDWGWIVVTAAGILTLWNLLDKIISTAKKAKDPLIEINTKLNNDNRRIEKLEKFVQNQDANNRIQMRALLAIVGHLRAGNHTDAMLKVEDELKAFLIDG
jgi:hypothetical protein